MTILNFYDVHTREKNHILAINVQVKQHFSQWQRQNHKMNDCDLMTTEKINVIIVCIKLNLGNINAL